MLDLEPGQAGASRGLVGRERKARGMHAEDGQTRLVVSSRPGARVRQRAHAVELREVEEVHEDGAFGGETFHGRRLLADPAGAREKRRGGDVESLGPHGWGNILHAG